MAQTGYIHGTICAALGRRPCRRAKRKAIGRAAGSMLHMAGLLDRIREIADAAVEISMDPCADPASAPDKPYESVI
jgi:hypothetical protein